MDKIDEHIMGRDEENLVHTAQDRIALLFQRPPSSAFVGDLAFFFSGEDLKEDETQGKSLLCLRETGGQGCRTFG